MIRLRRKDKSAIVLPKDVLFVEFVDNEGKVIQVFSENPDKMSFSSFGHPSDKADRYSKYFGVDFVKQHYDLGDGSKLLIKNI